MTTLEIRTIELREIDLVVDLWQRCGLLRAYNEPLRDIESALKNPTSDVLAGFIGEALVASAMVGFDGHRGYVYYVAIDSDRQDQGLGRELMSAAETWLKDRGVWKVNLMVRESNAQVREFYENIGYESQPRILYTKWLEEPEHYPED